MHSAGELPLSVNPSRRTTFAVIPPEEVQNRIPTLLTYLTKWIVSHDPPVHTRMRKLLVKAFSKKVVESVRPYVQARVAQLLDEQKRNENLEFVEGIARQLPGGSDPQIDGSAAGVSAAPEGLGQRLSDGPRLLTAGDQVVACGGYAR